MNKLLMLAFITFLAIGCNSNSAETENKLQGKDLEIGEISKSNAGERQSNAQPAPTTVEIIDSVYNFGDVQDGAVIEFSYRFKNIGTEPLIIQSANASCGCTVPEKPEQPILPGETGFIKVKFDSKGRVGKTHKTVTVKSNAIPDFPILQLNGDVKAKPAS